MRTTPSKTEETSAKSTTGPRGRQLANAKDKADEAKVAKTATPEEREALVGAVEVAYAMDGVVKDRGARMTKANVEGRALAKWEKDSRKGDRPLTPNYDLVEAMYNAEQAGVNVNRWRNGEGDKPKVTRSGAVSGGKTRIEEGDKRAKVKEAVDAGATTAGAVRRYLNERGLACSVDWIGPILSEMGVERAPAKKMAEAPKPAPAKATTAKKAAPAKAQGSTKKASARSTSGKRSSGPISKESQTRRPARKAS